MDVEKEYEDILQLNLMKPQLYSFEEVRSIVMFAIKKTIDDTKEDLETRWR